MLPEAQYTALYALACGMSLDEAWNEGRAVPASRRAAGQEVDPSDLVAAMERTPGQVTFVSGQEELQRNPGPPVRRLADVPAPQPAHASPQAELLRPGPGNRRRGNRQDRNRPAPRLPSWRDGRTQPWQVRQPRRPARTVDLADHLYPQSGRAPRPQLALVHRRAVSAAVSRCSTSTGSPTGWSQDAAAPPAHRRMSGNCASVGRRSSAAPSCLYSDVSSSTSGNRSSSRRTCTPSRPT